MCFAYTLLFVWFICRYPVIINLFPLHPKRGKTTIGNVLLFPVLLFPIALTAKVTLSYICYCLGVFIVLSLYLIKQRLIISLSCLYRGKFSTNFESVRFLAFLFFTE